MNKPKLVWWKSLTKKEQQKLELLTQKRYEAGKEINPFSKEVRFYRCYNCGSAIDWLGGRAVNLRGKFVCPNECRNRPFFYEPECKGICE